MSGGTINRMVDDMGLKGREGLHADHITCGWDQSMVPRRGHDRGCQTEVCISLESRVQLSMNVLAERTVPHTKQVAGGICVRSHGTVPATRGWKTRTRQEQDRLLKRVIRRCQKVGRAGDVVVMEELVVERGGERRRNEATPSMAREL